LVAREQPALDVATPEPGRLDRPGVVTEDRHGPLDLPAENGLALDIDAVDPRTDDGAVLDPQQIAELAHLTQVVVAARKVEEQVPHVLQAEPQPAPPQRRCRRQPGLAEWRAEQLDGIRRDGRLDLRAQGGGVTAPPAPTTPASGH